MTRYSLVYGFKQKISAKEIRLVQVSIDIELTLKLFTLTMIILVEARHSILIFTEDERELWEIISKNWAGKNTDVKSKA